MTRAALILATLLCVGARPAPRTIIVTSYCPCVQCCGRWAKVPDASRTFADGTPFNRSARVCAVDPRVFRFGTVFTIPGMGNYVAHDTGRLIKGNHIDIMLPTHRQAKTFGRRVYPLEFDPR